MEQPECFYQNLYSFITQMSAWNDEDTAIEYYYRTFSFGMLRDLIRKTVLKLNNISVKKGEKVILSLITTPESIALLYACNMLGIIPVLADVRLTVTDYERLAESTGAKHIFLNDFCSQYKKLGKRNPHLNVFLLTPTDCMHPVIRLGYKLRMPAGIAASHTKNVRYWRGCSCEESNGALAFSNDGYESVIFTTSGSTGEWKYVELKSYQLNMSAWQNIDENKRNEIKSVLSVMPLFTCFGFVVTMHLPLVFSKSIIVYPIYKAKKIPRIIMKHKPDFYAGVFSHFDEFLKADCMKNADLSFIKLLYFGGDCCDEKELNLINEFLLARGAGSRLCQGYGMTELAAGAFVQRDAEYCSGSVGRAMYFTQCKIVKEGTFDELPRGTDGEICINTLCQTGGYYGNQSATDELIKTHPDGKKWIHTGDFGHIDNDGNLFVKGRIKNMAVSASGTKIFPEAIEARVSRNKEVRESAVVITQNPRNANDKIIILYCVPEKTIGLTFAAKRKIAGCCQKNLPMYLVPDKIILCNSLPKTSTGKVNRKYLQKRAEENRDNRPVVFSGYRNKLK